MKKLIFYICLCISLGGYAQKKYEREYRIPSTEVPQLALDFIDAFDVQKKVKWYKEQGLNSSSVEAKFKLSGVKYSIEFSNEGTLQDIEQKVPFKRLENVIQQAIKTNLENNFDAYTIEKVQIQYTGNKDTLLTWRKETNSPQLTSKPSSIVHIYELIVRARTQKKVVLFEFQFDEKGQKIAQKEIITKDTDILTF